MSEPKYDSNLLDTFTSTSCNRQEALPYAIVHVFACRLFATLDPALRRVHLPSGREAILSDTVGFISDLPHQLVNAFKVSLLACAHQGHANWIHMLLCTVLSTYCMSIATTRRRILIQSRSQTSFRSICQEG